VSWYQKGKTDLDFTEARDSEWQWHQLGHIQVNTSLQTDNHANTHHSVFYRPDTLAAAQPTVCRLPVRVFSAATTQVDQTVVDAGCSKDAGPCIHQQSTRLL